MHLVAGATGHVGGEVVRAVLAAGQPVRALVRDGSPADLPDVVEVATGDLNDPASMLVALDGVSGLFLLPGYADMPGVYRAAREAGVQRVVQLSGMSAGSGDTSNAITAFMMASERAAHESGLPVTILRPSGFMSNTLQWLPQLASGDLVREPFARVPVAMIDPADIADVVALALSSSDHAGATYLISGPEALLPLDRVRILARVLRRDLRFEPEPDDEARVRMSAAMPHEYVDAFFDFYATGSLDDSVVRPTYEQITGRPPRTFRQWAEAHLTDF